MGMKIIFVNPNTEQEADKYLPKFLAQALINKIAREGSVRSAEHESGYTMQHSV